MLIFNNSSEVLSLLYTYSLCLLFMLSQYCLYLYAFKGIIKKKIIVKLINKVLKKIINVIKNTFYTARQITSLFEKDALHLQK